MDTTHFGRVKNVFKLKNDLKEDKTRRNGLSRKR
jgi:hypothetical protein